MEPDDKLPRYSSDLIDMLDKLIEQPEFPNTANGWRDLDEPTLRRRAFTAGARSLVDQLLSWRAEEEDDEDVSDGTGSRFGGVLRGDDFVRGASSPLRVDIGDVEDDVDI